MVPGPAADVEDPGAGRPGAARGTRRSSRPCARSARAARSRGGRGCTPRSARTRWIRRHAAYSEPTTDAASDRHALGWSDGRPVESVPRTQSAPLPAAAVRPRATRALPRGDRARHARAARRGRGDRGGSGAAHVREHARGARALGRAPPPRAARVRERELGRHERGDRRARGGARARGSPRTATPSASTPASSRGSGCSTACATSSGSTPTRRTCSSGCTARPCWRAPRSIPPTATGSARSTNGSPPSRRRSSSTCSPTRTTSPCT